MSYAPLVSALVTSVVTAVLLSSKLAGTINDVPNDRSLHQVPTPRLGGIGLFLGVLAGWAWEVHTPAAWILLPLLALFILSIVDDMRGLSVRVRFAAHFVAAFCVVWGEGLLAESLFLAVFVIFAIVWMINLYNFMDGSDGLAGGMALFGFSGYGIGAWMAGDEGLAAVCFAVAGAAAGFLYFNFHPAKVFMGDAGSITLGFLAAAVGVVGWHQGLWPMWFPVMLFSPFVVDATVTLLRRALRGERVWQAHREHYYQRLVQLGVGHRNTALLEYCLMFLAVTGALWGLRVPEMFGIVVVMWCSIFGAAMLCLDYLWKTRDRA